MRSEAGTRTAELDRTVRRAKQELQRLSRPDGEFDAQRYFRGPARLAFYNVGADQMRELAKRIYLAHRDEWSIDDAMAFADILIQDEHLEAKTVGIEVVARYASDFTPRLLPFWKRWLARNHSSNWATTDALCAALVGPLLVRYPQLVERHAELVGRA